jgi:formylglycine-generating enzyme required for sulfatase activity
MQKLARATILSPAGVLATAIACGTAACDKTAQPRPQLVVVLDTDVPVPEFADRVRIELFDGDDQPLAAVREVVISSAADLPISFGFRAPDNASTGTGRLRVRAYRSSDIVFDANGAQPQVASTMDRLVNLRVDPGSLGRVIVVLRGDCIGLPSNLSARTTCLDSENLSPAPDPEPAIPGLTPIPPTLAGSWPAAQRGLCAGTPRPESGIDDEDMCVRGGAFYFGTPQGQAPPNCYDECDRQPPRVAVMSPFFIDRYEVSVRRFRAALLDRARPFVPPSEPAQHSAMQSMFGPDVCTWIGPYPSANDVLPLNCVDVATARAFCQWEGGDLPTEAQWEYAASRAFSARKEPYPWGTAPPTCGGTLYGRFNFYNECVADAGSLTTTPPLPVTTPFPDVGASCSDTGCAIDVTPSNDGGPGLVGLAGNVFEYVLDVPAPASDPCWAARRDPVCLDAGLDSAPPEGGANYRGGGWIGPAELLTTSIRTARQGNIMSFPQVPIQIGAVGFRCVRPGH